MTRNETMVQANGVQLCVETFGAATDPAILLIGGGAASMDWWEDEFCERLAAAGRFVIRYDLRDTGRSVSYPPGTAPYGQPDLAADALGLLDAVGVARAHLVGMSIGGGIAMRMTLDHPDRVATLTLVSTTPGVPGLPPMSPRLEEYFASSPPEPDWTDREAVIDSVVDGERAFAGAAFPVDEPRLRELVGRVFDRTTSMESSATNHGMMASGAPVRPRLGEVTAPTLVIHGTEDPMYPFGHAEASAAEIPGARLLPLEGVGHQMPPRETWDIVVPAILSHTSRA